MAAGVLAVSLVLLPRERLLQRQAKWITKVNNGDETVCLWLSDRQAILMPYRADINGFDFSRLDTNTSIQTPLDVLNRKYRASLGAFTISSFGGSTPPITPCSVSPDRKWLLFRPFFTRGDKAGSVTYIATTLDGTKEIHWHSSESINMADHPLWLPDGRHWLELQQGLYANGASPIYGATLRDVDQPRMARHIRINRASEGELLNGITANGHLLQINKYREQGGMHEDLTLTSVQVVDRGLLSSDNTVHQYRIRLPMSAVVRQLALSSRGDRLAWLFEYEFAPPHIVFVHRFIPSVPMHSQWMLGLWVSNLDGSDMTEIGHVATLPKNQAWEDLSNLQWLPSGKRLSFIHQSSLYLVELP
jgi:hypothetical protein